MRASLKVLGAGLLAVAAAGCHTDMWVQPKEMPQDESTFFADKLSSRPLVPGTVARGHLEADPAFFRGRDASGQYVTELPMKLNSAQLKQFLLRGEERFNIYCTPCHGRLGDGNGMIAKRGLQLRRPPASYHTERLRNMPIGHFYDVMTNGYGVMYSYASRVEPQDRWAIAAYIRALQLSENASKADYDAAVAKAPKAPAAPATEGGE